MWIVWGLLRRAGRDIRIIRSRWLVSSLGFGGQGATFKYYDRGDPKGEMER